MPEQIPIAHIVYTQICYHLALLSDRQRAASPKAANVCTSEHQYTCFLSTCNHSMTIAHANTGAQPKQLRNNAKRFIRPFQTTTASL